MPADRRGTERARPLRCLASCRSRRGGWRHASPIATTVQSRARRLRGSAPNAPNHRCDGVPRQHQGLRWIASYRSGLRRNRRLFKASVPASCNRTTLLSPFGNTIFPWYSLLGSGSRSQVRADKSGDPNDAERTCVRSRRAAPCSAVARSASVNASTPTLSSQFTEVSAPPSLRFSTVLRSGRNASVPMN
jgi:hypothetical protein